MRPGERPETQVCAHEVASPTSSWEVLVMHIPSPHRPMETAHPGQSHPRRKQERIGIGTLGRGGEVEEEKEKEGEGNSSMSPTEGEKPRFPGLPHPRYTKGTMSDHLACLLQDSSYLPRKCPLSLCLCWGSGITTQTV